MIVAIDGPAGAGKSSVAKRVASVLGFHYLDTGAMYRAVAFKALSAGIELTDEDSVAAIAQANPIEFGYEPGEALPSKVYIAGRDVSREIRTPEIDAAVSPVAALPAVRTAMVGQQREIASSGNTVVEGRDIGTTVFPDAELKVFITAHPEVRARRRAEQNLSRNMGADFDTVYEAILARDRADSERAVAPLAMAEDAVEVDTSHLTFDEVVARVVELVEERR